MKQNDSAIPSEKSTFLHHLAKRLLIYTVVIGVLFLVAYAIDYFVGMQRLNGRYATAEDAPYMPSLIVSLETLIILFAFIWLIGAVIIFWQIWIKYRYDVAVLHVEDKEQLQKTILRRYQKQFLGSVVLYTIILCLIYAMMLYIGKSRTWYNDNIIYYFLKVVQELAPFLAIALWVVGIAFLLYRQWRQSAADVVGLVDSIEQMQIERPNLKIIAPRTLPEIQPILQNLYDTGQSDRRAAKEAEQRRNELILYLAHDLKTPLTSIIGYLSLLVEQPQMAIEQKSEYSKIALDKAIRLESLINQFFEISRYNTNEMSIEREKLDLKYLLIQLTDEFFPILEPQGKTITLRAPDDLWINGDADKLARVFNNIIRNAVAYSYKDSEIHIEAIQKNEYVTVQFRNRGKTIPKEQLSSIFNKFFRLDSARGSDTGGAGLGLAIAREIVALHGGIIEAESEDEMIIFTVSLPKYFM